MGELAGDSPFQAVAITSRLIAMECFIRLAASIASDLRQAHLTECHAEIYRDVDHFLGQLNALIEGLRACRERFPVPEDLGQGSVIPNTKTSG